MKTGRELLRVVAGHGWRRRTVMMSKHAPGQSGSRVDQDCGRSASTNP